jgi:hypothetical protein
LNYFCPFISSDVPQTWTIIGGTVVLGGIILTVVYEHQRSKAEELEKKLQLEIEARSLPQRPAELTLAQVMDEFTLHDFSHPERPTTSTTHC